MRELRRRLRPRPRTDDGLTLVELLVVMIIFSAVLAMTYSVLITVQKQTRDTTSRAEAVGEARLALQQIDRQVRSGNVLTPLGLQLQVYTQANGVQRCVEWEVDTTTKELRTRSWSPTWTTDGLVSGWSVVARDVVNTSTTPPFKVPAGSSFGTRLVDIELLVKSPTAGGDPIDVSSSLSGRNTAYGYDPSTCTPAPPA
ncbi:type II secretion system protein J [Quadrisphaera sp. GCM10027208]|uniref:PulJ/GspJ family protein n=1 Tax=Quadrisphaera sp. GCM10027208 TaxID=3273423 RepID=UPI0036201A8B